MASDRITVRGAREHNLKDITVEIPRDKLVVVTGPSGSGKSSLAFDTIYAEGQRRYVESLSAYARQFLNQNQKPDVESIEGLSPAIAIEQKSTSRNPRSTVGTLTEIYDYLRLLYARVGRPHCWVCGRSIERQTVQQIVDQAQQLVEGTKFLVLSPVVRGRKGEYRRELDEWRREGFVRVRIDGETRDLEEEISLDKNKKHTIELVVDRLVVREGVRQRLTDSIETSLKRSDGLVVIAAVGGEEVTYSERFACSECNISVPEIEPRMFSFNSPYGACEACDGLGHATEIDPDKVVPDPTLSLADGAIKPWTASAAPSGFFETKLQCLCEAYGKSMETPWKKLPKSFRKVVLFGTGRKKIDFLHKGSGTSFSYRRAFEGVVPQLLRRLKETQSERARERLQAYMSDSDCHSCGGSRLRPAARSVQFGGQAIYELCAMPVNDCLAFIRGLELTERDSSIATGILKELTERLSFLEAVGLEYLSLDRTAATLSGGEAQRIRLATQIGSALRGVIYVLDEPSIGLHQRDNARLLKTLQRLRDLGNTVLVVEHDEETIRCSDHVIDLGPGAGVLGGEVVVCGVPEEIEGCVDSLTGDYLAGRRSIETPSSRREGRGEVLRVVGARGNNLKSVDVDFPLGKLVCVTGVSGSGKSTLVNDTLQVALAHALNGATSRGAPHDGIDGLQHVDKVINIDQSPIGRTPRSNPATYTQLFSPIRDLFAQLPESRARGYKPGRFSFNVKGGRCEACEGDGLLRIEMHFLPDVFVTCEQCVGHRYNRETLEIKYKGKSVADILEMSVDEAADFLQAIPVIKRKLETLVAVGLGYVQLGQSATTLSGGEAQRIKLSRELSKRSTGRTVYILDEPTTGLHFCDVDKLLFVLSQLVEGGNTVIIIEHNLDVIRCSDHVIDLGPEGGSRGGEVIATGTPEDIARVRESHTGAFLQSVL